MVSRRTLISGATAAVAAAAGGTLVGLAGSASAATYGAYVMGHFKENQDGSADSYALSLATSTDGLNWTSLNKGNPVVTPTSGTGGLRDPFILRKQDGQFVVLATDLKGRIFTQNNQYIHVWDSANLTGFTGYRRVKLHSMATHSWAPTAFWVPSRNQYAVVYSAYNGTRDVFMVNYTTDFINMGSPSLYFDPGHNILDPDVLINGSTFYLAYKNMVNGLMYVSRSTTGAPQSYTTLTGGMLQGGAIEAPILVKSNTSNTFWLWGDSFAPVNAVFYAWQTTNIDGNSWSALNRSTYKAPVNAKHASITPITAEEQAALVSRWGT